MKRRGLLGAALAAMAAPVEALASDDTVRVQALADRGYIPSGAYRISRTIRLRGRVRAGDLKLFSSAKPVLYIESGCEVNLGRVAYA